MFKFDPTTTNVESTILVGWAVIGQADHSYIHSQAPKANLKSIQRLLAVDALGGGTLFFGMASCCSPW